MVNWKGTVDHCGLPFGMLDENTKIKEGRAASSFVRWRLPQRNLRQGELGPACENPAAAASCEEPLDSAKLPAIKKKKDDRASSGITPLVPLSLSYQNKQPLFSGQIS